MASRDVSRRVGGDRSRGHKKSDTLEDLVGMYERTGISDDDSRNSQLSVTSVTEIIPKNSTGREVAHTAKTASNKPNRSAWSSSEDEDKKPSGSKSKKPEVPVQRREQEARSGDKFFRLGSSLIKSPPRTPNRGMSPAAKSRNPQSSEDDTPTKKIKRQDTYEQLHGKPEKPLSMSPHTAGKLKEMTEALQKAKERTGRAPKDRTEKETARTRKPTEPTSKPKVESEEEKIKRRARRAALD
ncbi:hypothetical protein SBOR_4674 [Sclerotinia borealis F-4128]|uniref:Uncharacterized protein n=1 Tax=Sclerotinia borealis (strain F-4128) TaxID=1432307 RepID=W9CKA1_SCLBF|nr:hypothetical protein SBOR_4674 [Sclerotinia borealis F-4128]